MNKVRIGSWVILLMCWWGHAVYAQQIDAFVRVHMSPTKVVEKQPIKVKVTVYSSTWFAEPLDFQNVQVPNAFILPFSRTLSGIHHVNGKQYSGLEFFFLVFPYQPGEYTFPALEIKTSIPPEGDYIGKPVTLTSRPVSFTVEALPKGKETPEMVAKNVYLSERWSSNLETLKVGDVVTRIIFIRAKGTLPSFISSPDIQEVDFASIYSREPTLKDERDDLDANGLRVEHHAYLFEKEGTFEIPELSISWWNPYAKRKFEKTIPAITINVMTNPDLGMVSSVKDSLDALNKRNTSKAETQDWRYYVPLVISYGTKILFVVILFTLLYFLTRRFQQYRRGYRKSERYYFDQLVSQKNMQALYQWYDAFRNGKNMEPAITRYLDSGDLENHNWSNIIRQVKGLRRKRRLAVKKGFQINP